MWVEIWLSGTKIETCYGHPLREDVSWNKLAKSEWDKSTSSSSSWGCELKCYKLQWYFSASTCHPLREDVSWNALRASCSGCSSGHPLREDVSWNLDTVLSNLTSPIRHPLREDVSWNRLAPVIEEIGDVILFVRMWVEICFICSGWLYGSVILFVRMWVEISDGQRPGNRFLSSSSSWGCELKW